MFLLCFLIRFPRITKKQKTLFLSGTKNGGVYNLALEAVPFDLSGNEEHQQMQIENILNI